MKIPTRVNRENKLITYKYSKRFVKTTRSGASKSDVKFVVRVGNPHRPTPRAELLYLGILLTPSVTHHNELSDSYCYYDVFLFTHK